MGDVQLLHRDLAGLRVELRAAHLHGQSSVERPGRDHLRVVRDSQDRICEQVDPDRIVGNAIVDRTEIIPGKADPALIGKAPDARAFDHIVDSPAAVSKKHIHTANIIHQRVAFDQDRLRHDRTIGPTRRVANARRVKDEDARRKTPKRRKRRNLRSAILLPPRAERWQQGNGDVMPR